MTYYEFIFEGGDGDALTAATAIEQSYPNLQPVPETTVIMSGGRFGILLPSDEVSDPSSLGNDLATAITNATGSYAQVDSYSLKSDSTGGAGGSAGGGPLAGGINLGNFLNSVGTSIHNALSKLPSLTTVLLIILAILLLIFGVQNFSKGLGEGVAQRV